MCHSHSLDNFSPDIINQVEEELFSPRAVNSFVFKPACLLISVPFCHNKYNQHSLTFSLLTQYLISKTLVYRRYRLFMNI